MTGPIIHIGYHKTGTTWFQKHFYPFVNNRRYVPRRIVRAALLAPGALHFDVARARTIIGDVDGETILCEENLSGGLHNGGLAGCLSKDVAGRLQAAYPDARIVIFTRDQSSMIAAAYMQYVKGGGTHGLRRYLFGQERMAPAAPERDEAPRFRFEHFEYDRLVALYDELFGADRVHVWRYEEFRSNPRTFTRIFAEFYGLDVDFSGLDFSPANPSLSRPLLVAARGMNLFTRRAVSDKSCLIHVPGWYRFSRRLLHAASGSGHFGPPLGPEILGAELTAWIGERYTESNAVLAARRSVLPPLCLPSTPRKRAEAPAVR